MSDHSDNLSNSGKSSLYDRDFYAWANEQAGLLRAGKLTQADIENIAEEIESMGALLHNSRINRDFPIPKRD